MVAEAGAFGAKDNVDGTGDVDGTRDVVGTMGFETTFTVCGTGASLITVYCDFFASSFTPILLSFKS